MKRNKNKDIGRNKIAGEKERRAKSKKISEKQNQNLYNDTEYTKYNRQHRLVVIRTWDMILVPPNPTVTYTFMS